jgi:hypothetical protein
MKDFFGVEVMLGDTVVCMMKGYRSLMEATVIEVTDKTVVVEYKPIDAVGELSNYRGTYRLKSDQFMIVGE